jgi:RimJ/RimL family protein N-acetyltransferase
LIEGERIILRGFEIEDAVEIIQHFNDMEVRRFLGGSTPFSKDEEEQWIRRTWELRQKRQAFIFGIELKKGKKLIGATGLHEINPISRSSELGIVIFNKQYWGQGLGSEAIKLILAYGFYLQNLHSVYLRVLEHNKRAIRTYEKLGFKHQGRHRKAAFHDGQYRDLLLMDILIDEFRKLVPPPFPKPEKR